MLWGVVGKGWDAGARGPAGRMAFRSGSFGGGLLVLAGIGTTRRWVGGLGPLFISQCWINLPALPLTLNRWGLQPTRFNRPEHRNMGGPPETQGLAVIGVLLEVHSARVTRIGFVPIAIL